MKRNIIRQRFNRLVVIKDDGTRSAKGDIKWLCRCDCGNLYHALGYRLRDGLTKSCGCLNAEKKHERFKDLTNTETEYFKIISRSHSANQRVYWNCVCRSCGKGLVLSNNDIRNYTSCGCRRGSSKAHMDSIRDPDSLKSTKPTAKSTTGVRGVYFNKKKNRYVAYINVGKKSKYIGSSRHIEKAAELRRQAEEEYGYRDKK